MQHAYEGHRINWNETKILKMESNYTWRKYKESVHMTCETESVSQHSLEMSRIWFPLISKINKSQDS